MAGSATELVEILRYKPPSKARVTEIASLIEQCGNMIGAGQDAQNEIAQLNALSRTTFDVDLLANYWRSMSAEELATDAARPSPPVIPGLSRDQLIAIAGKIRDVATGDQGAMSWYLELFEINTPSGTSDLFFWPDKVSGWKYSGGDNSSAEPTLEEIVDRAMTSDTILHR